MEPSIHERIFEYCFNTEFCDIFNLYLVTHPDIPTTRQERKSGYDVRFSLGESGRNYSVFFQHKVSRFNNKRYGSNKRFYDCHKKPYYIFHLTNHQHNTLKKLSLDCPDVYYSAPLFYERHELSSYAKNHQIVKKTIKIPLINMPFIPSTKIVNGKRKDCRNNITYDEQGRLAFLHIDFESNQSTPYDTIIHNVSITDYNSSEFTGSQELKIGLTSYYQRVFVSNTTFYDKESINRVSKELMTHIISTNETLINPINLDQIIKINNPVSKLEHLIGHICEASWLTNNYQFMER